MDSIICVDIGNQNMKLAEFNAEGKLLNHKIYPNSESLEVVSKVSKDVHVIISDVSGKTDQIGHQKNLHIINAQTALPFKTKYKTPETLGTDRLCGLAGALFLKPDTNCLVFNLGTCLTIDFVSKDRVYSGGNISPGLSLRYKSLHQFTAKLPLITPTHSTSIMGNDTQSAISNGVQNGIQAEMEFYVNQFLSQSDQINIFLTGGDAVFFEKKLKTKIFAAPFLNLYGLFNIAQINGII
ncbi:MAG: type III pantothenate kinase [Bacteroidia bacterium]|nr:type III pantothenate kinase [Bacteroidia bacterium]